MVRVRTATPADTEAIAETLVASIEAFGPTAYDDHEVEAWATLDEDPADHYDLEEGYWVLAERDGDTAGVGHLNVADGEVMAVYVHPDHARAGVGSTLLASLEGYARAADCAELTLTASKNAVPFYERMGYERVEDVVHETSEGVELDCVRMRKSL